MKLIKKSSIAALLSVFALSLAVSTSAKAEVNPFAAQNVMTITSPDGHEKGKCGEGKCGGDKAASMAEGKMEKAKEGKCGEGKCGSM